SSGGTTLERMRNPRADAQPSSSASLFTTSLNAPVTRRLCLLDPCLSLLGKRSRAPHQRLNTCRLMPDDLQQPGNATVARSSRRQFNQRPNGEPMRVLSEKDWQHWKENGFVNIHN